MPKRKGVPHYDEPTQEQIKQSLVDAVKSVPRDIDKWRLVYISTSKIQGGSDVELERRHMELPDAWVADPESIQPIVIRSVGKKYRIVDGYRRFEAARQAKVPALWAVEVSYS